MTGQLLKPILVCHLLLSFAVSSFGQFRYDEILGPKPKGKIDSVITTLSDQNKTVEVFDKKRQLVEFYEYRNTMYEFGMVRDTTRTVYYYDKKGLLSKSVNYRVSYFPGASPKHQTDSTIWHFVKEGNIYITKFGGFARQEIYKLNSSFQLVEEYDSLTYINRKFNTYDKNGYLVKVVETSKRPDNTILTFETYYTNDADGNVIVTATKGPIFKYRYTRYDKMHNWLERNNYKYDPEEIDDYLNGKLERRITYYK